MKIVAERHPQLNPGVMSLQYLHPVLWAIWLLYWKMLSRNVKPAVRKDSRGQVFVYTVPLVTAVLLFWISPSVPPLDWAIFPDLWASFIVGTILLIVGLLFAVWARNILGRNWSGRVTIKEDHELIETGPYRWVRHPIYTGIIVGFIGSALAQDEWVGFLIVALVFVAFWIKLRREEAWMMEVFGGRYSRYRERTASLIPFLF